MTNCDKQLQALLQSFCTETDLCFDEFTPETKAKLKDYLFTQDGQASKIREAFKTYRDCDRANNNDREAICNDSKEALRNLTVNLGVTNIYGKLGLDKQANEPDVLDRMPPSTKLFKGVSDLKDVIDSQNFDAPYLDASESCLESSTGALNHTCISTKRAELKRQLNDLVSDVETNGCVDFGVPEQSKSSTSPQPKVWTEADYLAALDDCYILGSKGLVGVGIDDLKILHSLYC
jgi:hypothetical protein